MSVLWGRRAESRAMPLSADIWSTGDRGDFSVRTVDQALRLVPVYAAWRLIADQVASLPLHAYRRAADGTRQQLPSQPSLCVMPSLYGTAFDWKQRAVVSMLSRGNAVGVVTSRDGNGTPTVIEWLNPDTVTVDEKVASRLRWYANGTEIPAVDVVHIPAMVVPGRVWGVSPLTAFRATLETGRAAQQTARDWFANGAVPSAHMKNTARVLDATEASVAKSRYKASVRGRDVLVTGMDWDLETIGVPADEARFIETLKLTATQVASIYGIPPEMIGGETGSSLTYSTVEQNSLNFVTYALRPWLVRLEESLSRLLPQPQYVRFNVDALVRADLMTRMQAHEVALRTGVETIDEARALEDKPPLTADEKSEWLGTYRAPSAASATRGADHA